MTLHKKVENLLNKMREAGIRFIEKNDPGTIKISARFTGAPGSLGYQSNKRYQLTVFSGEKIIIRRKDDTGYCPYSSIITFLENWSDIKRI
jgi:hypothetical protein